MKYRLVLVLILSVIVLAMCLSPYSGKNDTGLPGNETPIEISQLFEPQGNEYDGWIKFYTNDSKYYTPWGYTLWTYTAKPSGSFTERTVRLYKTTGDIIAGYGVIICSDQQFIEGKLQTVFLTVMINNNGQYSVGKVIDANYLSLEKWKYCASLNKAQGNENTIRILKDTSVANKYYLFFNEMDEGLFFVDNIAPYCNAGKDGYIVVISPSDLNKSSVEVWFKE